MYEALQCFNEDDYIRILNIIKEISTDRAIVYLGSIPDIEHIWSFYNTPARKEEYFRRKQEGNEAIGTWWNRQYLDTISRSEGFEPEFVRQHPTLHTAHYRFDLKLHYRS
jgi:hypothetical protein